MRILGDTTPFAARLDRRELAPGVEAWDLVLDAPSPAAPKPVTLEWSEPLVDAVAIWTTAAGRAKALAPEWSPASAVTSKATAQAPIACVVSASGANRVCAASSDGLHESQLEVGVVEETAELRFRLTSWLDAPSPATQARVTVRVDRRRDVRYEQALADAAAWWAALPGYAPTAVPEAAREAMYSTWYSFHQRLEPALVEEQCRLARELGCGAVIIDDGWQTLDESRGYAYCGDWEPERIPDLRGHVDRLHALGMKVMLWYAVPWIGTKSRAFTKLRDRLLYVHEGLSAGVLDPRYPEVREHVIATYERAMRAYDLDGLKLDFVDRFKLPKGGESAARPGRDFESPEEAVDALLGEVVTRLRKIRPDVLVEFRQTYVGPLMRKYGNMFRAADCPADHVRNRVSTVDVRLLAGDTAVHADMLMWHAEEPVESAALQLLAVLFSVPQISVRLDRLPADHVAMLRFWLSFWRARRHVLLDGALRAEGPEHNYPLVRARDGRDEVCVAYAPVVVEIDRELDVGAGSGEIAIVNATRRPGVVVDTPRASGGPVRVRVHDAVGRVVSDGDVRFSRGVARLDVPAAGVALIGEAPNG